MARRQSRRSWTREQKQQLVKEARRELAMGKTFVAVARALEVQENSLRLWMKQLPEAGLRQVEIVGAGPGPGIALVTPDGFRVEGIDIESVAALLECLR